LGVSINLTADGNLVDTKTDNSSTSGVWDTISFSKAELNEGSYDWDSAGEEAVIILHMQSKNSKYVRVGNIELNYER